MYFVIFSKLINILGVGANNDAAETTVKKIWNFLQIGKATLLTALS
jgi:hypothetical protein